MLFLVSFQRGHFVVEKLKNLSSLTKLAAVNVEKLPAEVRVVSV